MEAKRQLYLGDLHVKQNQVPQAIEVYEKAWGTYRNLLEDPKVAGASADHVAHRLADCFPDQIEAGDFERGKGA